MVKVEKNITVDYNPNEGMVIGVMFEGEDLAKLKSVQQYLQGEIGDEMEVGLQHAIKWIVGNFLEESVEVVGFTPEGEDND